MGTQVRSRGWLGVLISDIPKDLPIKKRDFDIWVLIKNDHTIGFVSFKVGSNDIVFIKQLYVCPDYRNRGYARRLLLDLLEKHPKIDCTINEGNEAMYHLVESVGIRRHKPSEMLAKLSGGTDTYQSRCFSNHLPEDNYEPYFIRVTDSREVFEDYLNVPVKISPPKLYE